MSPEDLIGCVVCRKSAVVDDRDGIRIPVLWHWIDPFSAEDVRAVHSFGTLCDDCAVTAWAWRDSTGDAVE